ncbi:YolD-like family protein [Sutcliffiella sp. NPDC057660]|uniref:YolD-like family protein n=1 Tax=Sutcliffiella sp. NPDC057660 TaxID=3346199 RepID=UPI0036AC360E
MYCFWEVQEDYYKTPRPQLDQGQIEEMEQLILESFENQVLLEIMTLKNGFITSRIGTVTKVDPINKKVIVKDEHNSILTIDFFTITSAITK